MLLAAAGRVLVVGWLSLARGLVVAGGRLVMGEGTVPKVIWFVLFLGAALTIAFTFFFGTENLIAQSLMTGILAAIILSAVLVVLALDRPYTGAIRVSMEPILWVLEGMGSSPAH